jgi:type VI secretion system secreted protein VgrG
MEGSEALSSLFDFRVTLVSKQLGIAPKALLGNDITLAVETEGGGARRYLSGLCTRFALTGRLGEYHLYEARLRPWLWLASRRSDSKIFQQQKVPDIVESVLGKYGFPIKRKLTGSYRVWDYCVQYHETDLNFVSRIMEHEGIYYYFEHKSGSHTLVLCDGMASHTSLVPRSAVKYFAVTASAIADEEHFFAWRVHQQRLRFQAPQGRSEDEDQACCRAYV